MLADYPAPEVPARPITDDDIPRNARSLLRKADGLGLTANATYARGTDPFNGHVVDSVVVRLDGDGFFACASWHRRTDQRYRYETGYAWRTKGPRVRVSYRALVEAVTMLSEAGDAA